MTNRPMYNIASAVTCRTLAIVGSLPLPGCDNEEFTSYEEECTAYNDKTPPCKEVITPCKAIWTPYHEMGLDARKPVFGGLRTTQAQTSLRIRAI